MCGIACSISRKSSFEREEVVDRLLTNISHRGHDGVGILSLDRPSQGLGITLGHRRLSVIDLDTRSNQPFTSKCGKVVVSFNGEIYNYKKIRKTLTEKGYDFVTQSDTEVIVAGYLYFGVKIFDMLQGMFAILLFSVSEQLLYLVRDFFGIKPIYYHESEEGIIICSESKAISHVISSRPHLDKLHLIIGFGYGMGFPSVYAGIKKVRQGEVLTYNLDTLKWNSLPILRDQSEYPEYPLTQAAEQCLTRSSVEQTVSDIGFGLFLSGGIDSGLLASILKKNKCEFPAFTAGDIKEKGSDAFRAKILTDKLDIKLHSINLDTSAIPELMRATYQSLTEPILDSSLIYSNLLSELASSKGVRVVLSGAGGDEFFYGYSRYSSSNLSRLIFRMIPLRVRQLLAKFVHSEVFKSRLRYPSIDFAMQIAGSISAVKGIPLSYLETSDFGEFDRDFCPNVESQNRYDLRVYLPENILLGFDQTTMMHTVEGRVPYLDQTLYNLSRRIAPKDHMAGGRLKSILKDIASSYLPSEYLHAPKQGFSGPVSSWVNGNRTFFTRYAKKALDLLYGSDSKVTPKEVSEFSDYDLFNLTALQIWVDRA